VVAEVAQQRAAAGTAELGSRSTTLALARLVDIGAAAWAADGRACWTGATNVAGALAASRAEAERQREVERSRLEMMRRYAEHAGCRRSFLLSYFGQNYPGPCGTCDNDRRHRTAPPEVKPFPVGTRVASDRWGEGAVQRYDGDQVTVLFDDHGYRDLLVPLVVERGLLKTVPGTQGMPGAGSSLPTSSGGSGPSPS
jgi:ATP-dependent DNA helicase RecQ